MAGLSSTRSRVASLVAVASLLAALTVVTAAPATAAGPLTLTPPSAEITPGGSLDVVVRNTSTKRIPKEALKSFVTPNPSDAPFQVTNRCHGVSLGRDKTCVVTIAYPGAAPAADQTATLKVKSKKLTVLGKVTGIYTVKAAPTGCAKNTAAGSVPSDDLQAVLDAATDGDTIEITGTCFGAAFAIGKDLALVGVAGTSPTLFGDNEDTTVGVLTDATATITGLTITNGGAGGVGNLGILTLNDSSVTGNTSLVSGGGGIVNLGTLTVNDSSVTGNAAPEGGGIMSRIGTVTLNDSSVSENTTTLGGGGINNNGVMTLNNSSVSENDGAGQGGGIENGPLGSLTLDGSSVVGNRAVDGGGIWNRGTVILDGSSVIGNTAFRGGGIENFGSITSLNDSWVSGNTADSKGGGIYNITAITMTVIATVTLTDTTVGGNAAPDGGGIYNDGSAVLNLNSGTSVTDNIATAGLGHGGGVFNVGSVSVNGGTVGGNIPDDCVGC